MYCGGQCPGRGGYPISCVCGGSVNIPTPSGLHIHPWYSCLSGLPTYPWYTHHHSIWHTHSQTTGIPQWDGTWDQVCTPPTRPRPPPKRGHGTRYINPSEETWDQVCTPPVPPVNRMTDTSENITFPQLCWRTAINDSQYNCNFYERN